MGIKIIFYGIALLYAVNVWLSGLNYITKYVMYVADRDNVDIAEAKSRKLLETYNDSLIIYQSNPFPILSMLYSGALHRKSIISDSPSVGIGGFGIMEFSKVIYIRQNPLTSLFRNNFVSDWMVLNKSMPLRFSYIGSKKDFFVNVKFNNVEKKYPLDKPAFISDSDFVFRIFTDQIVSYTNKLQLRICRNSCEDSWDLPQNFEIVYDGKTYKHIIPILAEDFILTSYRSLSTNQAYIYEKK